jgi:hypothetical protein
VQYEDSRTLAERPLPSRVKWNWHAIACVLKYPDKNAEQTRKVMVAVHAFCYWVRFIRILVALIDVPHLRERHFDLFE